MKKRILIIASIVIVVSVATAAATCSLWWPESDSTAHAMAEDAASPGGEPSGGAGPQPAIVSEGAVVPARYAALSMAAGGIVDRVLVAENDEVPAGQVILRLRNAHQQAAVAEARAALANAEAGLAALQAGPRAEQVASARAGLDAAKARLARLNEGAREEDITAARVSLEAAEAALQRLFDGPDENLVIAAEADLANAQAALRQAQAAYDLVAHREDVTMLPQSLQLEQATNAYQAALARHDALFAEPDAGLVAGARAQVAQAQASLDRLRDPVTASEIAEAEAGVRQAEAQLDLLLAGSRAEEIAAAEAAVDQAKAALQRAEASLADTELRAPFAGTVAVLNAKEGEQVGGGLPVAQLADLTSWLIETDDLSELDVVGVQPGDRVTLAFDAIEDLELGGTVERIKALGEEKQGDITYTVVIRPDGQDARLRWRMTAVVTIP